MPKQILNTENMTEQEWQAYREKQKGIGGSDVATILGLNPYKSPFTLWLEKTGQIEPPVVDNDYVKWGNILEAVVRDEFAKVTGFEVLLNPWVLQHDEYDFMVANIDGEVIDPAYNGKRGVLEIKTASERMKSEWVDGPPNNYMLQVQHYLAVLGYEYAYIAVLIGGNHFQYFKIERDDYVIDAIISAEMEFTRMVKEGVAPEISGHSADSDWIASTYPDAIDEEALLDAHLEALAIRYTEVQAELKALQEESNYLKNRIKSEAKEYRTLKSNRIKISMPTVRKKIFDSKGFAEDHPELYEKYKSKESSYRNFTVAFIKEK